MFIVQISPKFSGLYIKYPQVLELNLFTVSSLWGESSTYSTAAAIHPVPIFHSTWYPLLLSGKKQCGFKACPRLLHVTGAAGIEPQTLWWSQVQCLNHSATNSIIVPVRWLTYNTVRARRVEHPLLHLAAHGPVPQQRLYTVSLRVRRKDIPKRDAGVQHVEQGDFWNTTTQYEKGYIIVVSDQDKRVIQTFQNIHPERKLIH